MVKVKTITISIYPETLSLLKQQAEKEERKVSQIATRAIREYVERRRPPPSLQSTEVPTAS